MNTSCWALNTNAITLRDIFDWCLRKHADRMLLVVGLTKSRGKWKSDPPDVEKRTKAIFGPHILEIFLASAWPGTRLFKHASQVFVIEFNSKVAEIMLAIEPNMNRWLRWHDPPLPEDLCLYRTGGEYPFFISVTHENFAWALSDRKPSLKGATRDEQGGENVLFFRGRHFCEPWLER